MHVHVWNPTQFNTVLLKCTTVNMKYLPSTNRVYTVGMTFGNSQETEQKTIGAIQESVGTIKGSQVKWMIRVIVV